MQFAEISLICPRNDLESATILELAVNYGLDVRESKQKHGGTLGKEPAENLENLKPQVIIIELPDELAEKKLEVKGLEVIIIDHHNYQNVERWQKKSSLEQFCELIDHTMTLDQRAVAVNDRDFIPGLFDFGFTFEKMSAIRRQEREITGTDDLYTKAKMLLDQGTGEIRRSRFSDLDVVLAPEKYKSVLSEAIQFPSECSYNKELNEHEPLKLKPCLLIFHDDTNRQNVVQIEFYGASDVKESMDQIVNDNDVTLTNLNMWSGGGNHTCFWGAQLIDRDSHLNFSQAHINKVIDDILSFTLIQGRPLRYFRTDFLFPFRWRDSGTNKNNTLPCKPDWDRVKITVTDVEPRSQENKESLQEAVYFLPYLREMMYEFKTTGMMGQNDTGKDHRNWWKQIFMSGKQKTVSDDTVEKWILSVNPDNEYLEINDHQDGPKKEKKLALPVQEIALYRFFNNIYMLGVSVGLDSLTIDPDRWKEKAFWKNLVSVRESPDNPVTFFEDALTFNKFARIVYSSFDAQIEEDKITDVRWFKKTNGSEEVFSVFPQKAQGLDSIHNPRNPRISPVIIKMLGRFFPENQDLKEKIEVIIDDRMFTHTCISLAGDKPSNKYGIERYNAAFSMAVYVDRFSDVISTSQGGYVYDKEFTVNLLKGQTNTRWYGIGGNLYGFTRYSSVYMAFGPFFHQAVSMHVRKMYLRLSIFALFYRTSLLHYSRRMAEVIQPEFPFKNKKEMREYTRTIQEIVGDFLRFANKHWFREITAQDQGIELFNLQCKEMDIEKEYKNIRSDVERTHQFLDMKYQTDFSKLSSAISWLALSFAGITIISGFFGMNFSQIVDTGTTFNSTELFWGSFIVMGLLLFGGILKYLWVKR